MWYIKTPIPVLKIRAGGAISFPFPRFRFSIEARPHPLIEMECLFGTARYWETCQEQASSVDGSKLKTPHLVRGVHVCKEKTMPFTTWSLWKVWSMQPYLGSPFFPPSGLLKSEERKVVEQGRRVFFEFVTPPRSSRIRQLRQEKEAIDAMISSIKSEIPRLRITEQLPTSTLR